MHEIIKFLKAAVTRGDGAGVNGCYIVRNNSIYCRNLSMQAGVDMESGASFNVPAEALDKALDRMREIDAIEVKDDKVTIRSGRMRSTIKLVTEDPPGLPTFPDPGEWSRVPDGLARALELSCSFIGEERWQKCLRLMDGRATVFQSAMGIDVEVPKLVLSPSLLTKEVVEFIVAQGAPEEYVDLQNAIAFRWSDGRWMRAQLYNDTMPEGNIAKIFESAGTEIPVEVTQEMREAFADAAAMSDKFIMMTAEGFMGKKGENDSYTEVESPMKLPEGHRSYWHKDYLGNVLAIADAWNPLTWPAPCYFEASGLRGVLMGASRW